MNRAIRILLVDDNREFVSVLNEYFSTQPDMSVVGKAYNGADAVDLIRQTLCDVVILDMIIPNIDGLGVIEFISDLPDNKPKIIVLSSFGQERIMQKAIRLGVSHYLLKPFDLDVMGKRIRQLFEEKSSQDDLLWEKHSKSDRATQAVKNPAQLNRTSKAGDQWRQEQLIRVTQIIQKMGVPAHVKGYQYLRDAILAVIEDPDLIGRVTRELYPKIAVMNNTSPTRVERAIRHAIELAWDRGNMEYINRIFGYTINIERGKPTNSEFIALIADKLKMAESVPGGNLERDSFAY